MAIDPSWIQAGSAILSAAAGKPPAPAVSSASTTSLTNSWFDGSGWTVATGASSAKGGDRADTPIGALANAAGNLTDSILPLVIVGALVGLLIWKKR